MSSVASVALIRFVDVGGDDDRHVRQTAHQRQVLERVMRASGHAQRNAARGGADHHALVRVGDVVSHLLHAAGGDERCIGAHVRTQARGREPGSDADRILLGDAQARRSGRDSARCTDGCPSRSWVSADSTTVRDSRAPSSSNAWPNARRVWLAERVRQSAATGAAVVMAPPARRVRARRISSFTLLLCQR